VIVLDPGGPRTILLIKQAYAEEGLECPDIDERTTMTKLLYPRSYVDAVNAMPGDKTYDYCFVGGLYRPETYPNREWILDFARHRFTDRSYLLVTDGEDGHERLGAYDRTGLERDVFVPKLAPPDERAFFHDHFFRVLRHSQFTLCPAGDVPWSMRFFEAIMCKSIPIVSDPAHVGRNELERAIGYQVYFRDNDHVYDDAIVHANFRRFLRHQTLIDSGSRS
jgi:hypothetical protein